MNKKDNVSIKELVYGICCVVDIKNEDEVKKLADEFNNIQSKYTVLLDVNNLKDEYAVPMYRITLASNNIKKLSQAILRNDKSWSTEEYVAEIILSLKTVVQQ